MRVNKVKENWKTTDKQQKADCGDDTPVTIEALRSTVKAAEQNHP
jgi:hypothetical protein